MNLDKTLIVGKIRNIMYILYDGNENFRVQKL